MKDHTVRLNKDHTIWLKGGTHDVLLHILFHNTLMKYLVSTYGLKWCIEYYKAVTGHGDALLSHVDEFKQGHPEYRIYNIKHSLGEPSKTV
jgi:hypothetical protein